MIRQLSFSARLYLLLLVSTMIIIVVFVGLAAIPQDLNYHNFADQNHYLNLPNTWNVISNLPFILFGLPGLVLAFQLNNRFTDADFNIEITLFAGIILTGFGSGYYHIEPNNITLVWDRLPMTISFMAFLSLIITKHIHPDIGRRTLLPFVALGLFATLYWAYTESLGRGDLRAYALIQFLPMLLIPAIIILFPTRNYQARYVYYTIGFYILAKLFEHFDKEVFSFIPISGHSIKHIAASFAGLSLYQLVKSCEN